jgi:pimeloyl-ACP methyl ester carboxylesterase
MARKQNTVIHTMIIRLLDIMLTSQFYPLLPITIGFNLFRIYYAHLKIIRLLDFSPILRIQGILYMNLRKYGTSPYQVAVVHGGPGAAGEMATVARELALRRGVLEPLQTVKTIDGQVGELRNVLEGHGDVPVVLIGYSWGAWLSSLVAARYKDLVRKLILVSSGPFEERYAHGILDTRLERLSDKERLEVKNFLERFAYIADEKKNTAFSRFGELMSRADMFDPLDIDEDNEITYRVDIHQGVWRDAAELRRSGKLFEIMKDITCPVIAIHGDYDPHPAEGVEKPLKKVLKDFRFVLLKNCGHKPWGEKNAWVTFYKILENELI